MALHPKVPMDLALAPVAVQIDVNLQRIRDRPLSDLELELQLELNRPAIPDTRDQRAADVLQVALRDVDLHNWEAAISQDGCRLQLIGGSVSLDLGLSAAIMHYIEDGASA